MSNEANVSQWLAAKSVPLLIPPVHILVFLGLNVEEMVQPDDRRRETEPRLWPAVKRGHEETYEDQRARVKN